MTTRAAKDMFLPPLTTLVTRLMETTSSLRLRRFASIFFFIAIMSYIQLSGGPLMGAVRTLEIQSGFAGCVSEGLYTAVIQITATIEDHLLDALLLSALCDQLADFRCSCDVA